ncbi:alpha/beta fold hydrolase [Pseudonocardia sp. C8]|uniref:alpha/beta fold hydrolase n=1 Tax=Pseudonocardia sp. C8 TaxID=2762759 RepID=UPI001C92DD98
MTSPDGLLPALTFGDGPRLAVAVHGITASAMEWPAVARCLPADWTLVAPDLRGRGAAAGLPGPYGLQRHVEDVCALVRARRPRETVLVGHSMGAYVALLAAVAEPGLFDRLVLVDGGLPLPPPPEGVSVDEVLQATLGPAIARLSRTFESEQAYLDFFRAHPALADAWNEDVAGYVRYDLAGPSGAQRSRVVEEAVRADGRDVLVRAGDFAAAWEALTVPGVLLRAPLGLFGEAPGLLGDDAVAEAGRRRPDIVVDTVDGANHYTIVLDEQFAARVARRIAGE